MATVSIAARTNYSLLLEEKLEHEALTGFLDLDGKYVGEVNGAGQVNIPKFSVMDGLYDYENCFTDGNLSLTYQQVTLAYDRGVSFTIDRVADANAAMVASGNLMNEFYRTQLVPEVDAARFSRYAQAAGANANGTITAANIIAAIDAGEGSIGQVYDPSAAILFISWEAYAALKSAAPTRFFTGGEIDRNIEYFDGMRVVKVPAARFNAVVTKNTENGGLDGSNPINFLMVVPQAVQQVKKFEVMKIFTPDENQTCDAWKFQIRLHHDAWVLDQAAEGVYVHTTSALV